ncbi:MAG: NAD-dependent epimerase/dehydratase family protein [Proteobacteria bacterium]|nr:NAD-dependent epimerase/dehydratase family protein [Pseudomonadota bacterium]MBU1686732.1 NAD-dependent epimerase/dehydratase family protein [Pseudomonadota bacterium]
MKNVLVTGGAGFIGSHTVDLLLGKGYKVRVLDNLEYPTHLHGNKTALSSQAEFLRGDIRNIDDLTRALSGIDWVLHLAATGGFTPDIGRYFEVNSVGTANLLELIQQRKYRVERLVVASSVGIYGEGLYQCETCGPVDGVRRSLGQLTARQWEMRCVRCGREVRPVPTPETKTPSPEKAYSMSKFDQERLVLGFGRDFDLHTCALRYFLTYGPGQSLTNPYTGVISLFSSRLLNDLPPILYEDGEQSRDFIHVSDVAEANLLALESDQARDRVFNVGSGRATKIKDVVEMLAELTGKSGVVPEIPGEFRPGESRHIYADITAFSEIGFKTTRTLKEGLSDYVAWLAGCGTVDEYLSDAMTELKRTSVVRNSAGQQGEQQEEGLSVIVPAYNEAGNLETFVRYTVEAVSRFLGNFEVIIVNDGSHDGTGFIADRLVAEDNRVRVVHHPFNVGYGGAQKSGFRHAGKEWAVVVPADHQFDVADLEKFYEARKSADIICSRRIERQDPMIRILISRFYNWLMRLFYHVPLRDLNWVKMFRTSIFEEIEIETHGFAVDAEIVVMAMSLGYGFEEIPVPHYRRTWGDPTGVSLRNLLKTALELSRIRGIIKKSAKRKNAMAKTDHPS